MDAVCEGDVGHLSEGLTKGTKAHIDSCLTSKAETALDYLIAPTDVARFGLRYNHQTAVLFTKQTIF
jgi:hypothetical protein